DACGFFRDLSEALKKTEADAVIIASPSYLHAEHARQSLEAGLGVMVEKPFTTSVSDALALLKTAKQAGKPIMVAENFRYVPAERTIRKLMNEKFLGNVSTVTLTDRRNQPASTQGAWVADMEFVQLFEIAIHHFDSLRSFFNRKPASICAQVYNPQGSDYKHGACTKALLELRGDIHVTYLGTLTSHRYAYALRIEGENGELWTNRKWVLFRKKGSRFFRPLKMVDVPPGDGKPYPREGTTSLLNSLRDAVLLNVVPETAGEDNIWNVAMVAATVLSVKEGRSVSLKEVLDEKEL
ncbi:MAG: Gfo/Idh/MocA family oxidoreductase, partial [Desulfobacterales bacterium]